MQWLKVDTTVLVDDCVSIYCRRLCVRLACGEMATATEGRKRSIKVLSAGQFHTASRPKRCKTLPAAACPREGKIDHKQHSVALNPLKAPYRTFKSQKEAFEFIDQQPCACIMRTFAQEVSATGKRVFIAATAEQFWQHYKALPTKDRHHYEIIREAKPCNLYFDLEFCPQTNPDIDGPSLVQLLVSGTAQQLQQCYDISFDPSFVLELDSSTATKFSRHIIVQLPGLAFADCCHAGRFARLVLLRLLQQARYSSQLTQLLVRGKDGQSWTTFVDMGVYTRNRAFRLYLSSKFGKDTTLRLTPRFGGASRDPKAAFFDLLVSVLHNSNSYAAAGASRKTHSSTHKQQRHLQRSAESSNDKQKACRVWHRQRRTSLLYVDIYDWHHELQQLPVVWQEVSMLQVNPLPHLSTHCIRHQHHSSSSSCCWQGGSWQQPQQVQHHSMYAAGGCCRQESHAGPAVVHHGPSPYPLLERFIAAVCSHDGVQGEIRSWVSMPASASVAFNIKNNRWCGNVERQHKSNGVYYIVDLAGGVYYQKCYDPECRNYRSNYMPLPTALWQQYRLQPACQQQSTGSWAVQESGQLDARRLQDIKDAASCSPDEYDECLQLLQRVEAQQGLHRQSTDATAAAADAVSGVDTAEEDDLCLQLLEEVERMAAEVNVADTI